MAQFGGAGGGVGAFGVASSSAIVVGSAAATDRTAEFLRLAAAAKATQNPSSVPDTGASLGAPSTITSTGPSPLSAASSTASTQSDFARRAAAVGAGIHATSERLRALAALARRTSSFDDPAAEIADLSARIKRDIAGLNGALSELAAVGARSRSSAASVSSSSSAQRQHSATVVDGLRLRLRDAASQFRDVLDARQKSLAAHADRRARFSSSAGAGTSGAGEGAGGGGAGAGATAAGAAAPGSFGGRGGFASSSSSLAPRHQPLFAPRPPPRPPGGGATATSNGPASAAFAAAPGATASVAAEAEKYVRGVVGPSSPPSAPSTSSSVPPSRPPPRYAPSRHYPPAAQPTEAVAQPSMLRQRGGMARYGGGGRAAESQPLLRGQQLHQQQQMHMLAPQDSYLASRAGALQQVESTIAELGGVFQQLATLVAEQGDMAIRIDEHVDEALGNVEGARTQLMRHLASISSDRWLVMKCLGVLLAFALFFIFVVA